MKEKHHKKFQLWKEMMANLLPKYIIQSKIYLLEQLQNGKQYPHPKFYIVN